DRSIEGIAETGGAPQHRCEHGLNVGRGARDDAEDLGRRRLLLQRLRLALQRLSEALLELAVPRAFVLPRLAGNTPLALDLRLRGLHAPPHRPLLHSAMISARLHRVSRSA